MSDWRLAWRFARRELRGGVGGFRVFLACLALGVGAIAGVGSLSDAVVGGLRADAKSLLGGDVSIQLVHQRASEAERDYLAASGVLSEVSTMRSMVRRRDGARRSLVELKAIDAAYPLYGNLDIAPGQDHDTLLGFDGAVWGVAVDPNLLSRLDIAIGDTVRVGDADFVVRGEIIREPDRASASVGLILGPRVLISREGLAQTGLLQPGSLINHSYRLRLPDTVDPAVWRRDLNAAFPDATWRVQTTDNAAPRLDWLLQRLTLFLTLVGLTVLLVGGVGVANAIRAYLERKTGVIATLKCVGASHAIVFRTFFLQVMALAGLGIALGVVVGALVPVVAGGLVQPLLPVTLRLGVSVEPLALAAVLGVLTTLTFAVWPLARAGVVPAASLFRNLVVPTRMRPPLPYVLSSAAAGAALAAVAVMTASDRMFALAFVGGSIAVLVAFLGAGVAVMAGARRLRGIRRPGLRLAIANLHRPGASTPSVVLSLGLGLTVLITIALIEGNFGRRILQEIPERAPAFFVIDIQRDQIDDLARIAEGVDGFEELEDVPMLRGRIVAIDGTAARDATVAPDSRWALRGDRGVTWSVTAPENSPVVAGDWWPADYDGPPLISFDEETAAGFGVGIGDTLTVNVLGREIEGEIVNLRHIDWGNLGINFLMIFSPGVLQSAPFSYLATIYADEAAEEAIERDVTDAFTNVSAIRVRAALEAIGQLVGQMGNAVRATASVALIAGILVVGGAVAAGHRRRVYDAVVLKVLGATRGRVLGAFLIEYGLLGVVTALIAAVAGTISAWAVVTYVMELEWHFMPGPVMVTAIACLAVTLILGFAATWAALGQKSAPLLRNE